ncbi:hypothetical protein ACFSHT_37400 [Paraburkholderia silviterrae]|uniref:Phage baseplate protein n=1 Tax=Paraburkholderia silviterrae TaxID=2528715 RepID=A0A4R5LYM6_9BURK|nr:hypothetical protein [Paraburkholderia silviterrae]TDG17371.1 hypothetical protein EYW47_38070 [Paraburkholderia silviterrae]
MRSLPDSQTLLALWERGEREHPIDRALSILEAFTGEPRDALAWLALRRRDELLIASRVAAFGPLVEGVAECEACACKLDTSVDLSARASVSAADGEIDRGTVEVAGRTIAFRLPDSHDLASIADCAEPRAAARTLIARCIEHSGARAVDAALDGAASDGPGDGPGDDLRDSVTGNLSDAVTDAVADAIERLSDASSIELAMTCPDCGHALRFAVDIGEFLWDELSARAQHLIDDVDALASAYGWSEAAILALPDARRRRYLERIR